MIKKLSAELIGLSIDQVFAHIEWVGWIKGKLGMEIPFPVIADDTGKVAAKLGMIHPDKDATETAKRRTPKEGFD